MGSAPRRFREALRMLLAVVLLAENGMTAPRDKGGGAQDDIPFNYLGGVIRGPNGNANQVYNFIFGNAIGFKKQHLKPLSIFDRHSYDGGIYVPECNCPKHKLYEFYHKNESE
ncbi:hypothetical protein HPB47_008697 [Ixodes persulcatus]|uniref:Uncharacterized protein n=1 Tax=Ixodes persulcatus TaxID=34615 RepID=A0AC60P492_IXOPE|nr:hypothetical protein HPB47_008697 [Ixodes persulcatus]